MNESSARWEPPPLLCSASRFRSRCSALWLPISDEWLAVATPVKYAIALLPILMGVYRLGWIRLPMSMPKGFGPGLGGAFGTGLMLSLIIGPCGTPVLASVLSYAAYRQSFLYGGLLLFIYGIGTGMPVTLVGTAAGGVLKKLDCSRLGNWVDPIVGSLLILLGFYLLWRI